MDGVTAGKMRPELRVLGVATAVGGGQLSGTDFAVTARWGIAGKGGITMPGKGKTRRAAFTPEEAAALGEAGVRLLGPDTVDVFLNDAAYWRNVPRRVWEYTLGGYQVLKKWLSYREAGPPRPAADGGRSGLRHAGGPPDRGPGAARPGVGRELSAGEG